MYLVLSQFLNDIGDYFGRFEVPQVVGGGEMRWSETREPRGHQRFLNGRCPIAIGPEDNGIPIVTLRRWIDRNLRSKLIDNMSNLK